MIVVIMEAKIDANTILENQYIGTPKIRNGLISKVVSREISASETLKRSLLFGRYENLTFQTLKELTSKHYQSWNFDYHTYYEFGTGHGRSLKKYLIALRRICAYKHLNIEDFNIVLFDSFQGLPDLQQTEKELNPAWSKGLFNQPKNYIESIINQTLGRKKPNIKFVEGFYDSSLTESLREELKINPPSFVNVDVDLYSSTKVVLDWLKPILQNGTIFHFDDVFEYLGNPFMGELAAIKEFNDINTSEGAIVPFKNFGIRGFEGKIFTFARIPAKPFSKNI